MEKILGKTMDIVPLRYDDGEVQFNCYIDKFLELYDSESHADVKIVRIRKDDGSAFALTEENVKYLNIQH